MSNVTTAQKSTKDLFSQINVKKRFEDMLGAKAQGFITSVLQCVAQNALLSKAEPNSVLQAAAVAATLDLPLNNNLGFAYIIPYKETGRNGEPDKVVAQFQMGYKGFIQLSQRSGQFKTMSASAIYEGQIVQVNPLTGYEFDFSKKISDKIIGYASYFKLTNGFEKIWYMSVDQVVSHGDKYSKTFKHNNGLWKKDFEAMALKTVLKLLLSKFAPMTIDMQKAVIADQSVINNAGVLEDGDTEDISYIDNTDATLIDVEQLAIFINEAQSSEDILLIQKSHIIPEELLDLFNEKLTSIKKAELDQKKADLKNQGEQGKINMP